jgi:hypothetical protein
MTMTSRFSLIFLFACTPAEDAADSPGGVATDVPEAFEPAPVPELVTESTKTDAPFYLFLFTHTEDPFNHELSEQRYTEFLPFVTKLGKANPDAHLAWTLELMGSDAKTIWDRDATSGIARLLQEEASEGVLRFGYHAHHEPTYSNRPQNEITASSSWEEKVDAMQEWVSCEKDLTNGGCVLPEEGGILAIEKYGPVEIVTGLNLYSLASVEHDASVHASRKYLPNRRIGYGYPNHGSLAVDQNYTTNRDALLERMTPSADTSSTLIWADNIMRINDGDILNEVTTINLIEGREFAEDVFASMDRSRSHIINTGIASKYHYTAEGSSPTQYGYVHKDDPTLPEDRLVPAVERTQSYNRSRDALTAIVEELLPANPGVRFVDAEEIGELTAPEEYFSVTDAQLDGLARWALLNWGEGPPDYVSDGTDFYSLRDLFLMLCRAIGQDYPGEVELTDVYGPFGVASTHQAVSVDASDLIALASTLSEGLLPDTTWQVTPSNLLSADYDVGEQTLNPAQVLYGLSMVYASTYAGLPVSEVDVPAGRTMPETLDLLVNMGCDDCQGTAWSLKPARIRPFDGD